MFQQPFTFAYFGSSEFSVHVLTALEREGFLPNLVISTPAKPKGRNLVLTPTTVTLWAQDRNIPVLTPDKLTEEFAQELKNHNLDLYIVASYGKIIPEHILNIPPKHVLNVHPSLLPLYRGSSPLQSAILNDDRATGVTIMQLDREMDHGPILAQEPVTFPDWPMMYLPFEKLMAEAGGGLLASLLPQWIESQITPLPQDHTKATYTKKISKEDGEIALTDDPRTNYLKYAAYTPWPSVYFFEESNGKKTRIKITKASFANGKFVIEKVIPEGKSETDYKPLES